MIKKKNSLIVGMMVGAAAATALVVALTVVGELFKPLKEYLADAHHHHWIGKGIWATILFVVVSISTYFISDDERKVSGAVTVLSYTLMMATVVLFLFFTYEYIAHH